MTTTEEEIWERWKCLHHNTAQIAKALQMKEHEVARILAHLRETRGKRWRNDDA